MISLIFDFLGNQIANLIDVFMVNKTLIHIICINFQKKKKLTKNPMNRYSSFIRENV